MGPIFDGKFFWKNKDVVLAEMQEVDDNFLDTIKDEVDTIFKTEIVPDAQENVSGDILNVQSGTLRRSIDSKVFKSGVKIIGQLFVDLKRAPYARIHFFGGTILQTVSKKQKNFFWRKFKKGGGDKWKAMALSRILKIKIPKRDYLTPALDDGISKIEERIKQIKESDFK